MALKKSQIYASLWQSCNELRGGMDASQYKDYILTLLFMKYVSDKAQNSTASLIEVPPGGSFGDMVNLKGDKEIGDKINKIIGRLAECNDLKGVIDQADFNDESKLGRGKEMQDRLTSLIGIFQDLDFSTNRAGGDDLLGDAYEYLMMHFATESGRSKGQFYTPSEVSSVMAKVIGIPPPPPPPLTARSDRTVYDPTCGSGSLLIKVAEEAGQISIYGQEMDNATWSLARMNMILHGQPTAELKQGNTLSSPQFTDENGRDLKRFDFAVANPPFTSKSWSHGLDPENDRFERFDYGVPPAKNGDYAFLLHFIKSLKSNGKGAIVLPHGVLFRGNKEAQIRRNLLERGLIKGVIGLPSNLFYGTSISACILVIDKEEAPTRKGVFIIDASKGFRKDGNKNRLREQDIHRIVDVFNKRSEIAGYSRLVPLSEISNPKNVYKLNISRYIESRDPEDLHDLDAHLNGGIPNSDIDALSEYWEVFPSLRQVLFCDNVRPGYSDIQVELHQVKDIILEHEELERCRQQVLRVFESWSKLHRDRLYDLTVGDSPAELIHTLSEDLLERFADLPILDNYDIYQIFMDYWRDVMQDDVYLIMTDGWKEAARPRDIEETKTNLPEPSDLRVKKKNYKMDLIPPKLMFDQYFSEELAEVEKLELRKEDLDIQLNEFVAEHSCEGGILEKIVDEKGKVVRKLLKERLKVVQDHKVDREELRILTRCRLEIENLSEAGRIAKKFRANLEEQTLNMYEYLSALEVKFLVVDNKWLTSIRTEITEEIKHLLQKLTSSVRKLQERYIKPLFVLERELEDLSVKVKKHIGDMVGADMISGERKRDGE